MSATLYASASHEAECCAVLQAALPVTPGTHPVISSIIAAVEQLYAKFGPSILSALPALLATVGVPVWLIPVIITIVSNLPVPAPAA